MAFQLNNVVPWGRNMEEYKSMFLLNDGASVSLGSTIQQALSLLLNICPFCSNSLGFRFENTLRDKTCLQCYCSLVPRERNNLCSVKNSGFHSENTSRDIASVQ